MAQAEPAVAQEMPHPLMGFAPIILMIVIFYFLLLRPQQKKQKEHQGMLGSLKKNDDVVTTGGIHGTIVNVKENTFTVRVDDNVKLEILKSAIAGLKKKTQGE